ncbi:hypothetical protein [Tessaracoccus sp.]|nr:hypothetical protein [Tessaracoccus sp.]
MDIFCCGECHTEYCHKCSGSNGGRQCPKCRSTKNKTVGKCYVK